MKRPIIIILLCLACGLCSCTQTDSSGKKSVGKTMAAEINSNYNALDTTYKPYERVENKDSKTIIWENYNNDKNGNATSISDAQQIITEIDKSIGLFGSTKKLKKSTEKINSNNVIKIMEYYKRRHGRSIFKAIMRNVYISSDSRVDAVKHIKDMCMQAMINQGVYTDDIDKLIDEHIDYEKNKSGRMNSKLIEKELRPLYDRYDIATCGKNNIYKVANATKSKKNILYPANSKIDSEFNQGKNVKDCWLIAAIKSLSVNSKGVEMLNDLISTDDKGNVTVKLKGARKEYTISKEELEGANELAQGDLDVRAIEIAIRRYFRERETPNLLEKIKNRFSGPKISFFDYRYDLYRGIHNISTPYYILFGWMMVPNSKPDKEMINNIKSGEYSTVVGSYNDYRINGYKKNHAYAAIGADDKYVYLSDPYKAGNKLKITHNEFLKFFSSGNSTKLSD